MRNHARDDVRPYALACTAAHARHAVASAQSYPNHADGIALALSSAMSPLLHKVHTCSGGV